MYTELKFKLMTLQMFYTKCVVQKEVGYFEQYIQIPFIQVPLRKKLLNTMRSELHGTEYDQSRHQLSRNIFSQN